MAKPQLRVLFFDTFGTVVAQRKPVADELWKAAQNALQSNTSSISGEVRAKAMKMTYEQWFDFGGEWNKEGSGYVQESIAKTNSVDWRAVDDHRIKVLPKLLAQHGLIILRANSSTSEPRVEAGSLWNESQLKHLGLVWHRLTPWPDTLRGLELVNKQFPTVSLSNTYNELLEQVVAHGKIPFTHLYTSDMFHSFKPNPKVYLGAAEKMGVKPEECALVAAHLYDLKAAKELGFYSIYVERPLEEKNPELRESADKFVDIWIKEGENGFITLAERLGIRG